MLESRRTQ